MLATWCAEELALLDEHIKNLHGMMPNRGKYLCCYLWDYGAKKPMPIEKMRYQCEKALEWLRQEKIEGIVFVASCVCDLDLESVEWTHEWIATVSDEKLCTTG